MFTVILLSDRAFHRFERWKVLFEPFEEAGLLRVCKWNRGGPEQALNEVVPELSEAIYGKSDWRAIVVDTSVDVENDWERTVPGNPFDFLDNLNERAGTGRTPEQLNLEPSPHPLIHLAHLLLGYPDITPKTFVADPSYWDPTSNRRIYQSEITNKFSESDEAALNVAQFRAELGGKRDVQVHYRELPYTGEELKLHRQLTDRYRLLHIRPKEVIFLATREPGQGNSSEVLRRAWRTSDEYQPSRFIERNDYPPSSRFVVHDLPKANDNRFQIEKIKLWLSLLCIAVNEVPGSALQSERVYGLEVKLDETKLADILNEQLTQLTAEQEFIENLINQPRKTTDSSVDQVLHQQQPIRVAFDEIGGSDLTVSVEGYSWATDRPRRESIRWQESINELRTAAESFSRRPRRALKSSVDQARTMSRNFRKDDITLDNISLDELEEELTKQSQKLAQPTSHNVLDRGTLGERIEIHDSKVRRTILRRMEKRTVLAALTAVTLTWIFTFTPYIALAAWNTVAFLESFSVMMLTFAILGTLGIVILLIMKKRFLNTIRELNSDMRHYVSAVNAAATEFTAYLTSLLIFMRGQAVKISSKKGSEQALVRRRELGQARQRIVEQMNREKSLIRAIDQDIAIEKGASSELRVYGVNEANVGRLFHWPVRRREVPLNESGEKIQAPYDAIQSLSIVKLDVPEPQEPNDETERVQST